MINARAESVGTKNAYKPAFKRRRCLIPADGFYEWKKVPGAKRKQPYFISRPDGEPIVFAGLWEVWRGPKDEKGERTGEPLRSATIITTTPNETMAQIHDRMPVILPPSSWDDWLDPDNDDIETLGKLLVPAPPDITRLTPVSTQVNSVRNKGPELITPATADELVTADAATLDGIGPEAG
jgi:putative SOS response-associated peptidase YedK